MTTNLANYLFNKETLYRNSPIEINTVEVQKTAAEMQKGIPARETLTPTPPSITFKHPVLILVDSISENEKTLLIKILTAIGLTLEQVDLIELSKTQKIDYQYFITQNITKKFVSFGVGLGKLNWKILLNLYQFKNIEGIDYLLSDELRILDSDLNLKKTLWAALKAMFAN